MKPTLVVGLIGVFVAFISLGFCSAAGADTVTVTTISTADNFYNLFINGGSPEGAPTVSTPQADNLNWKNATSWTGTVSQPVTIAVQAFNYDNTVGGPAPSPSNPAGFLAQVTVGSNTYLTSSQWLVYVGNIGYDNSSVPQPPLAQGTLQWYDPGYNDQDGQWVPATEIAQNGNAGSIWNTGNGGPIAGISSQAWWIWDVNNGVNPAFDGLVDSPVYLRLDATPEPATMGMLALGALALIRRRRK